MKLPRKLSLTVAALLTLAVAGGGWDGAMPGDEG